jgi:hypothetical protein
LFKIESLTKNKFNIGQISALSAKRQGQNEKLVVPEWIKRILQENI